MMIGRERMRGIGRNIERGIAMIVIGSSVWIIIYRFVRGRAWRMWVRLVFVSFPNHRKACVDAGMNTWRYGSEREGAWFGLSGLILSCDSRA